MEKQLNIDKSDWQPVKFGDVVEEKRASVADPEAEGLERIIGLEHIKSENIHIKSWGNIAAGTTFTRRFRKRQVLFGRRRAYLKKAALANFDGVCSGDIIVMQAKNDLLWELMPFLISSENFFDYAIKNSAGSLSPRVKFKDLAEYEFLLPPKEQHARLAELLWAADEMVDKYVMLDKTLKKYLKIIIDDSMIYGIRRNSADNLIKAQCGYVSDRISVDQLGNCLTEAPSYGANASSKPFTANDPRYIRITDIDDEGNLLQEEKVSIESNSYNEYILKQNDFLFARTGNTVGKSFLYNKEDGHSVYAGYLIRFRLNEDVLDPLFLKYFSKSAKFDAFKQKVVKIGAQPNINSKEYQSMYLPLPKIDEQNLIVGKLKLIEEQIRKVREQSHLSEKLQKSLINSIF